MSKEAWEAETALVRKLYSPQEGDDVSVTTTVGVLRQVREESYRQGREDAAILGEKLVNNLIAPAHSNLAFLIGIVREINAHAAYCSGDTLREALGELSGELASRYTDFLGHSRAAQVDPAGAGDIYFAAPKYIVAVQKTINCEPGGESELRKLAREYAVPQLQKKIDAFAEQLRRSGRKPGMDPENVYIAQRIIRMVEDGKRYKQAGDELFEELSKRFGDLDDIERTVWRKLSASEGRTELIQDICKRYRAKLRHKDGVVG